MLGNIGMACVHPKSQACVLAEVLPCKLDARGSPVTSSGASCEVSGKPSAVTDISVQPLAASYGITSDGEAADDSPNFSHTDGISLFAKSRMIIRYRNTERTWPATQHHCATLSGTTAAPITSRW